ncbi:MAG TPA: hypothetical protein VK835_05530 [Bacteroidia bacterium]|jgi:hypothetical protein|nr:hypothetical protein [Bacteroidia bacterium]
MSLNRRLNRQNKKPGKRIRKPINWAKLKKEFKFVPYLWLGTFIIFVVVSYFAINNQNSIRQKVAGNPKITKAKIIDIDDQRHRVHTATYEFSEKGEKYSGTTFHGYDGSIGDSICVKFSSEDPDYSFYCEDSQNENVFDDVFLFSLKMLGLSVGFIILIIASTILWRYLKGE